jgi:hypothetical protein
MEERNLDCLGNLKWRLIVGEAFVRLGQDRSAKAAVERPRIFKTERAERSYYKAQIILMS